MSSAVPTPTPVATTPTPAQAVTNLTFNHPKNYLCVPLALASPAHTDEQVRSVIGLPDRAYNGAQALSLVDETGLTPLGTELVSTVQEHTTLNGALSRLSSLRGSSTRFVDTTAPYWASVTDATLTQYKPAGDLVTLLNTTGGVTLAELAEFALTHDHPVCTYLFRRPANVAALSQGAQKQAVREPSRYAGCTTYQFKSLLYHCGVLTERGADTSALIPTENWWDLDKRVLTTERSI